MDATCMDALRSHGSDLHGRDLVTRKWPAWNAIWSHGSDRMDALWLHGRDLYGRDLVAWKWPA